MEMKKICVAGCKHTTKDLIIGLEKNGFYIDHCITISPMKGKEQKVAGYYDLYYFLSLKGINFTVVEKYNLMDNIDRKLIEQLGIDILLVMGWQRLIPDWFLNILPLGAFGMHGSSKPLPHGRGRSPINWSLIENRDVFYTHLFQYLPGVDDGPIIGVQKFDINSFDTCLTLHHKNMLSMIKLCSKYLPSIMDGTVVKTPQLKEGVTYYPKRTAEDGLIDWRKTTLEIYNLIRAVTHPFPGAFTYFNGVKNIIWRAIPFDTQLDWPDAKPGDVVERFYDGTFVVKTSDSSIWVQEYEYH